MSKNISDILKRFGLFSFILFLSSIHCSAWAENIEKKSYTIATWNIGHFSKGEKTCSTINSSTYRANYDELKKVLEDSINADVLCLNEYSEIFFSDRNKKDQITKDLFFGDYDYSEIGPLLGYSCNSIFSRLKLKRVKQRKFEISKTIAEKMPRAENYYYLESDLYIGNIKIKLVCAHTTSSANAVSQSQISELLNRYRDEERVIMCGDWNTQDFSLFKNGGYSIGNNGSLKTFPGKAYALDNIVVKGLVISDVRIVRTNLSDHFPLVCSISLK